MVAASALRAEARIRLTTREKHWKAEAHQNALLTEAKKVGEPAPDLRVDSPVNADLSGANESECQPAWEHIKISFLSDKRVQVFNGGDTETLNYAELGFADKRAKSGQPKPNSAWETMLRLAESGGAIATGIDGPRRVKQRSGKNAAAQFSPNTGGEWRKLEKRIQEIRKALRRHFGLADDPIPYAKGKGYQARFKISCSPSFTT